MLIVKMSDLICLKAGEFGEVESIVIDKVELPLLDENITVLEIPVSYFEAFETFHQSFKLWNELRNLSRLRDIAVDEGVQSFAIEPLHLYDGMPLAANFNSLIKTNGLYKKTVCTGLQEPSNSFIASLQIWNGSGETADCPMLRMILEMKCGCEPSGVRLRNSELIRFWGGNL
jgi:hypothetical protein